MSPVTKPCGAEELYRRVRGAGIAIVEHADLPGTIGAAMFEAWREAVDREDQFGPLRADAARESAVIRRVKAGDARSTIDSIVAGDQMAVAAMGDQADMVGLAVEIDHQPRDGGEDRGALEPRGEAAGERAGADVDGDVEVEQFGGDAEIHIGGHRI